MARSIRRRLSAAGQGVYSNQSFWSRNWHLLYFVLAGFDLAAIGFSLYLSRASLEKYDAAVSVTETEIQIQQQIVALGKAAQKSNAPGNDLFDSKDPAREKERFELAISEFEHQRKKLQERLKSPKADSVSLQKQETALSEIGSAAKKMHEVATQIFGHFMAGRPERAAELMALMDRHYGQLQSSIDELRLFQLQVITLSLEDHRKKLVKDRESQIYFGFTLLIAALSISIFGRRLNQFAKEALLTAQRNEEVLNAVSESAIIAFTDTKGKITEVNDNFCEISGYTREELIGQNHRIVNSGHHSKEFFQDLWRTISSGQSWTGDLQNRAKNGEPYFVRTVIAPLRGINQPIDAYMAIRFDVTALKRIENELLQAQTRAKIGSWSYDLSTGKQTWSSETYRIFEIENPQPEDQLHLAYRDRLHPEDRDKLDAILQRAMIEGSDFTFEHRISFEGGKRIKHVRGIGTVKRDAQGKPVSLSGTCQDLTDVVALREQNKFILESMGIGIWRFSPKTGDLHWDESMYKLFEFLPSEFNGHYSAWENTLTPEAKDKAIQELQEALAGRKQFDTTFEIMTRRGNRKQIGGRGVVIRNDSDEPIEMLGINWDRTREVELERLLDLEKSKSLHSAKLASLGEMSAGIAHEINNPLAIIAGNIPLLVSARHDDTQFAAKLQTLSRSVERIKKIVKGLQRFSRTADPFTRSNERLDKLIQEALTLTEAKSKRHSTSIRLVIEEGLTIDCDPVEIEQVFVNLMSNAIDAAKATQERWIEVRAYSEGEDAVVQFTDSGGGIPHEIEAKLFQPFFTTKPIGEGTGLGLSISKGILDHHQATITLLRNTKNTCFEIRFKRSPLSENSA